MKVSCCIEMLFARLPLCERVAAAKACGCDAIEFWKWSDKDLPQLEQALKAQKMRVSIFNLDSADEKLSYDLSRGIVNAGRVNEFLSALYESVPVYHALGASALIVLIGENAPYNAENVGKCLTEAIPVLEREQINLVLEPLNATDRKGYAMPYASPVLDLIGQIAHPRIKMLYDIYHQNVTGDFDEAEVLAHIDRIGHFHVADAPGRHEPGTGNVDYVSFLRKIEKTDYAGYIGLEYRPTKPERETFGFLDEVRKP